MSARTVYILLWLLWLSFLAFMSVKFSPWWAGTVFLVHPVITETTGKSKKD